MKYYRKGYNYVRRNQDILIMPNGKLIEDRSEKLSGSVHYICCKYNYIYGDVIDIRIFKIHYAGVKDLYCTYDGLKYHFDCVRSLSI